MKHLRRQSLSVFLFVSIMLSFVIFLTWYVPSVSQLCFELDEARLSLETSRGRERKQQFEFEQVQMDLPVLQSELAELLPLTETAKQEVSDLKARRKELREEVQILESAVAGDPAEESEHE